VIFGGPSPEHDVSVLTGLQAAHELLDMQGHAARAIYWSKAGGWYEVDPKLEATDFEEGVPRESSPLRLAIGEEGGFSGTGRRLGRSRPAIDLGIVCCHGGPGEDGSLQAALDLSGIPYAGPTVAGAAIGMDKLAFGALMALAGLPTLPRVLFGPEAAEPHVEFEGPYILKPRFGGSSIGIEIVEDLRAAETLVSSNVHLANGAVIEPYRPDLYDLQVGIRSWPDLSLSAIERPLRSDGEGRARRPEILGYADKYVGGEGMVSAPRELPAVLEPHLEETLRGAALEVGRLTGVRGVARLDFLSDGKDLWVNEINTIPGSLARYLWIDPHVPFSTLLSDLIAEAEARPTHHYSAAGADGSVLRGASSIASKLA